MADTDVYSMTDAMVYGMQQPGAIAVAFVDLETGRAIAGDGINNLDIDTLTPWLTDFLITFCNQSETGDKADPDNVPEVAITTGDRVHMVQPLSHEGGGLYFYLALDKVKANVPMSRRCLVEIDAKLHL